MLWRGLDTRVVRAEPDREDADLRDVLLLVLLGKALTLFIASRNTYGTCRMTSYLFEYRYRPLGIITRQATVDNIEFPSVGVCLSVH